MNDVHSKANRLLVVQEDIKDSGMDCAISAVSI